MDSVFRELFNATERSAVHLEMRDVYDANDSVYQDWRKGVAFDPAERWPDWFGQVAAAVARGVAIRRARIVSEPVSEYVRYEYDVTAGLNIASGEQVRWLPRARHRGHSPTHLRKRGADRSGDRGRDRPLCSVPGPPDQRRVARVREPRRVG